MTNGIELEGELDRRVTATRWRTSQRVELADGKLVWEKEGEDYVSPKTGLLEEFIELADAPDKQVIGFARRWGMLNLCEHDFPQLHVQHPAWTYPNQSLDDDPWICWLRGKSPRAGPFWEPVSAWRCWARRARELLRVAADVLSRKLPDQKDWRVAFDLDFIPTKDFRDYKVLFDYSPPRTLPDAAEKLGQRLNQWIGIGNVRPIVEQRAGRPSISFGGGGLFGALAMQLMLASTGEKGWVCCSNCRKLYTPDRRPRADQQNYCLECRKARVPTQNASAASAMREKARRLYRGGKSVRQIAAVFKQEVDIVREWLKPKRRRRKKRR